MALFLQRCFDGLASGAVYATLAVTISVVHRRTGALNLAQGQLAMFGAHLAAVLSTPAIPGLAGGGIAASLGAPLPVALAIALAALLTAPLAMMVEHVTIRPVQGADVVQVVGATVALFVALDVAARELWGPTFRIDSPFPSDIDDRLPVAGAALRLETIGTVVTLGGLLVLLAGVHRITGLGLGPPVRSGPRSAERSGGRPGRPENLIWGLTAAIGAVAGGLAGSLLGVSPAMMVPILVFALAALVVGGFARPVAALPVGLALGVGESLLVGYVEAVTSDLAVIAALGVMAVVLLVRPAGPGPDRRAPVEPVGATATRTETGTAGADEAPPPAPRPAVPGRELRPVVRRAAATTAVVVAVVAPIVADPSRLASLTRALALTVALLGLTVVVGHGGLVSLGHGAMVGLGAWTSAALTGAVGLGFELAVPAAAVAVALVGLPIGLSARRLDRVGVPLVTLAVAVSFPPLVRLIVGPLGRAYEPARPLSWLGLDAADGGIGAYVVTVIVTGVAYLGVRALLGGRFGCHLRALRNGPEAAADAGVPAARVHLAAFALAAGLAGAGGALLIVPTSFVHGPDFPLGLSLRLFAVAVAVGAHRIEGAVVGGLLLVGLPAVLRVVGLAGAEDLIYALGLVVSVVALRGQGVARPVDRWLLASPLGRDRPPPEPLTRAHYSP